MLPAAQLNSLPAVGNRHNVFLAVLSVAGYHAYLAAGIERKYAIELLADVGWKLYCRSVTLPRLVARLMTRDPKRRVELMLRMLISFPFSAPGRPGYEVKAWAEPDRFCTYWTHCPPYAFVRRYVEQNGDHGELEAFRKSWCWYDWAITHVMVGGWQRMGHYERPHTLSAGDAVCDMCWYARTPRETGAAPAHALGLAVPLVVAVSAALAANNGLLIRNRVAFEGDRKLQAIIFDKTGTLTEGRFGVTDMLVVSQDLDDVAVETADVILVRSNPLDVVAILKLSRATHRKMIQNLVWATGYNVVAIPLAAGALYAWGVLLTPAHGAVLMSAITVIVAINGRLLRLKAEPESEEA
jgi:hypothetical protein